MTEPTEQPSGRRGPASRASGARANAQRAPARLDEAARAAWLYYVARRTQDEVAATLGLSRQAVQRLVARAVEEGLVRVRIDHPIAEHLELAADLVAMFGLERASVVPSDADASSSMRSLATEGAGEIERWLAREKPLVIGMGTGRTLKAAVESLSPMTCPQHRIVALTGSIAPDGSAAFYNVIFSMADRVQAPHFPLPVPVFAAHEAERDLLHAQAAIRIPLDLADRADVAFVGIADLGLDAPLVEDGFLTRAKVGELRERGAVGEMCGWVFDADGRLLGPPSNLRNASPPLPSTDRTTVIALAMGMRKREAIRAALRGRLASVLMTDASTARWLIDDARRDDTPAKAPVVGERGPRVLTPGAA